MKKAIENFSDECEDLKENPHDGETQSTGTKHQSKRAETTTTDDRNGKLKTLLVSITQSL